MVQKLETMVKTTNRKVKTMNNWVDNKIEKVEQKDIESNEQVMELADDIFSDYVEAHPEEEDKLQFWNEGRLRK
jgi:DNA helicase IV